MLCVSNFGGLEFNLSHPQAKPQGLMGRLCPRAKNNDCWTRRDDMLPKPSAAGVLKAPLSHSTIKLTFHGFRREKSRWFSYFAMQNVIQSFNCMALKCGLNPISSFLAPRFAPPPFFFSFFFFCEPMFRRVESVPILVQMMPLAEEVYETFL